MKQFLGVLTLFIVFGCNTNAQSTESEVFPVQKSESEWKDILSAEQFYVLREHGTERARTGEYDGFYKDGTYHCAACNNLVYDSKTKFDSGTGWPSYYEAETSQVGVGYTVDKSFGMARTEVHCANCGGHLGHVFNDGPKPTGKRHCINSVSLKFEAR